jgi:NAD(P)-dependent dehydrogenase (short-subunit alcohol dehydrogenase family)
MKRFEGQIAIIAGGTDGLGKGIAERIVCESGTIALFDVNKQLLDKTVGTLKDKGFRLCSGRFFGRNGKPKLSAGRSNLW